jgi:hypothetical protein
MRSLRRLSRTTFLGTAVLLGILVLTGFRQNNLMDNYNTIVKESEGTIFLYATIREQATEGLLSRDPVLLLGAAKEFEKLHSRHTSMLDNHLIPSQYKLSFLQDLDLERAVINLKSLAEDPEDTALTKTIIGQLRQINKQFLQFDRIIISEMRNGVMQYQKRALILMGLIIALTCFTLLILYQKSVKPLLYLTSQVNKTLEGEDFVAIAEDKNSSAEFKELIDSLNQLLQSRQEDNAPNLTNNQREAEFSAIVNEVTNGLNGIINYSQLLADYCEAEDIGEEQKEILQKIINAGEKSAAILQRGLHG